MQTGKSKWKIGVAGAVLALTTVAAHAVDSMSVEVGTASKLRIVRVAAQWDWDSRWFESNGSHLGGYWDLSLMGWRGTQHRNVPDAKQSITSIGFMPVARWQNDDKKGFYIEGGIGVNLLSKTYNNNGNILSTKFEFCEHVGIGYVFDNTLDVGLRFQHYSNAGIKKPNSGVNLGVVRVSYRF